MNKNSLRRKSRIELLELLLASREENQKLRKENEELKAQLAQRQIHLENSESLAHAALKLAGVFETADQAAALYLESLKENYSDHESEECTEEAL